MLFERKPDDTIVILLTGLGHINLPDVKELGGDKYVTALLDTLIPQFLPVSRIEIVSFEKLTPSDQAKSHYQESVTKAIGKTAFAASNKDAVSITFENEYLTAAELAQPKYSKAFILNFAGNEITDPDLLNCQRFIDVSLYHADNMQKIVKFNLKVVNVEGVKTVPNLVYNNELEDIVYVLDRREYSIWRRETDGGDRLTCLVSRSKLEDATKRGAVEEIKAIKEKARQYKMIGLGRSGAAYPPDIETYSKSTGNKLDSKHRLTR